MSADYDAMRSIEARMAALEGKQLTMASDLVRIKTAMDSNTAALQEFIELGKNLKFGIKILGVVESIAVWVTKVAAAVGILWAIYKFLILEAIRQATTSSPK